MAQSNEDVVMQVILEKEISLKISFTLDWNIAELWETKALARQNNVA